MAIFGVGANYDGDDVSGDFIKAGVIGVGWDINDAPELHQFIRSIKVADIVYIKAFSPNSPDIIVKAIGIIKDDEIKTGGAKSDDLYSCGRNVRWIYTKEFRIPKPNEKNNVRLNTLYEDFHPVVQKAIIDKIGGKK